MNSSAVEYSSGRQALTLRGLPSTRRQPVHIIFEVDISDSMSDANKLRSVKCSMEHIVPLLTPDDLVSIITFGETSTILLNKAAASDTDSIQYRIKSLTTDGCTNMSAGLMNIQTVLEGTPATHKQGVLLLTDGHANRGVSDPTGLKQIVTQLIADHPEVTLTTVGYGADHNADLLREMATVGAGSYNVVYNLDNVATVFGVVLGGLTTVVAQNVAVILPPGATAKTGYAQTTDAATGETTIRVGDIYAENEIMLLVEAPTGTPIRIQGHNMLTFAAILETLTPTPLTPGEQVPKAIEQTVFRQLVSELLKDATHTSGAARDAIKTRAEELLRQLRELPYADEQLIQMMMDDVRELTEDLATGAPLGATVSAQAANHSHYWATGRGVASIAPALPPDAHYGGGGRVYRGGALGRTPSLAAGYSPPASPPLGAAAPPLPATRSRTSNWDAESSPFINMNMRVTSSALRQASSAAAPPPPSGPQDPEEKEE